MGKKISASKLLELQTWQWVDKVDCGRIGEVEVATAYRLNFPACNNCRKNCNGNPQCLRGLGQMYWTSANASVVNQQEIDKITKEIDSERRKPGELVGLKNLGATCYVNTYLQLWMHNINFRNAIYSLKENDCNQSGNYQQTICGQLQLIFGLLQGSASKTVDPNSFIQSLGLPTDLQQDAQEFSKLFMSVLETNPYLSSVIQTQFSGKYAYKTKCLTCQTVTERPARFYELDLNVQGHKNLKDCILDFLKPEKLDGENQYHCDTCNGKRDAIRQIALKTLPQTLSLQLLRFVYDKSTNQRQKLVSSLSFPDLLDFSQYIDSNGEPVQHANMQYQLSAVLLHRGPSAMSGHYIANIKDTQNGIWYKFNDEQIAKLKGGEKLDLDVSKGEDNFWKDIQGPVPKKQKILKGFHSSKDVYMLVYIKRESVQNTSILPVPSHINTLIEEHNNLFEKQGVDKLNSVYEEQLNSLKYRKRMIDFIALLEAPTENYEWAFTSAIKQYLSPVQNQRASIRAIEDVLCRHGGLNVDKVAMLKYIPKQAADMMFSNCDKLPARILQKACIECVKNRCCLIKKRNQLNSDFTIVSQHAKSTNMTESSTGEAFLVGKQSFRKWKSIILKNIQVEHALIETTEKARPTDPESETSSETSDNETEFKFNCDLLCDHSGLTTNPNLYQLVPDKVWKILLHYFPNCCTFRAGSQPCSKCIADLQQAEEVEVSRKKLAQNQKSELHQLFLDKNRPNFFNGKSNALTEPIFIISQQFLAEWRCFVRNPTRNEPVKTIDNQKFLCSHLNLLHNPLKFPDGTGTLETSEKECVLLWEHEWKSVRKFFEVDHEIYIQKKIATECSVMLEKINPLTPLVESMPAKTPSVFIKSNIIPGNNLTPTPDSFIYNPELCKACIAELIKKKQKMEFDYTDADIFVNRVNIENESPANQPQQNGISDSSQTKPFVSNRTARRCTRGGKTLSGISSVLTIKELKIKIMHLYSVPPFDQNLWLNGKLLSDDAKSLGESFVYPGCTITLIEDIPNDKNIPEIFTPVKQSEPEVGFKGTGLLGH